MTAYTTDQIVTAVAQAIENSRPCPHEWDAHDVCSAYLGRGLICPDCPKGQDWDASARAALAKALEMMEEPTELQKDRGMEAEIRQETENYEAISKNMDVVYGSKCALWRAMIQARREELG